MSGVGRRRLRHRRQITRYTRDYGIIFRLQRGIEEEQCVRADEIAVNTVRSFPGATLALTGAVVLVAFLGGLAFARSPRVSAFPASAAIRKFQRAKRAREIKRALMSRLKSVAAA